MSIVSSAWVVVERPESKFNLYPVTPAELSEIVKIWGETPSVVIAERRDEFGQIAEQFVVALLYEARAEIEEAADYALPRVVEVLNSMSAVEKEIQSLENGDADILGTLGIV